MTWLGRHGWGLGNQLFQYAALLGVADRRGYDVRLPPRTLHDLDSLLDLQTPTFTTAELRRLRYRYIQRYPSFGYEAGLEEIPDWCDIVGFFQSRKHFPDDHRLRAMFRVREDVASQVDDMLQSLRTDRPVVGFHVRRGDSLGSSHWVQLGDLGYFERAMDSFADIDPVFLIVSDDLPWCRSHFMAANQVIAPPASPAVHLALLGGCDHLIIANSTFSWWSAWFHLPTRGRIIAPRQWYPPGTFDDAEQDRLEAWIEIDLAPTG